MIIIFPVSLKRRIRILMSIFVSVSLYNCTFAMTKEEERPESRTSTIFAWLSSTVTSIYSPARKKIEIIDPEDKDLEICLERMVNEKNGLEFVTEHSEFILNSVSASTLQYFIEQGARFKQSAILDLTKGLGFGEVSKSQKIEKLKLLLKAGYKIPDKALSYAMLFLHPLYFDYHCAYAKVLLNAGAHPNQPEDRTAFRELLLGISMRGKTSESDVTKPPQITSSQSRLQAPEAEERFIVNAFLICGADYTKVSDETKQNFKESKPFLHSLILSFEDEKAALFKAIDEQLYENIRKLALRIPFKVRNAIGDFPLHHAIRKLKGGENSQDLYKDIPAQHSQKIIALLLSILPIAYHS